MKSYHFNWFLSAVLCMLEMFKSDVFVVVTTTAATTAVLVVVG